MDKTLLQQIATNTDPKQGFSFIVSGNDSQILTRFNPPLQLKEHKTYEMALVNLETYYSIPNIHAGNNSFRYSPDDGANWFPIALSTGSYGINNISEEIQRQMQINKHKAKIILDANRATLRATLTLARHYQVDFNVDNSLSTVLGFKCQVYTYQIATNGYAEGEHIVNIISIESILVDCDIIHGSYVNWYPTIHHLQFLPWCRSRREDYSNPKKSGVLASDLENHQSDANQSHRSRWSSH
ncbi:unnamed protein product [Mytilus edulis]|uniref:Uncharacterized protein n=1 Tax=Mytilus edulis TaxID=6550 RepID=A0A8S3TCQ8_MYTED|nr:unnamed protein product [Mytilus edulis]